AEQAQVVASGPPWRERQRDDQRREGREADLAAAVGGAHLEGGGAHARILGNRPSGLTARTSRNARWPASSCHPGSSLPPIACATPRMTPPASVPHRLPSPP